LVEEMAASTQALETTATTVTDTVQVFRIDGGTPPAPQDAVALRRDMKLKRTATLQLGVASR
jgi:aerotaxis receptor